MNCIEHNKESTLKSSERQTLQKVPKKLQKVPGEVREKLKCVEPQTLDISCIASAFT